MTDKTTIGDRMKSYEVPSTSRKAFNGQPLIVRLDGKSFHQFTKGLPRPFDGRLSDLMVKTMEFLVDRFNATVGYTQSDEITLVFLSNAGSKNQLVFDGRFQKLESLTASAATAFFNKNLAETLPEKQNEMPLFDSRAFVVPNIQEAYHSLLWRQQDATKNAISMAAQSLFKHSELQNKNGSEMQEMLFQRGINFNDYPAFFKRGVFAKRFHVAKHLTEEELNRIPEKHHPTGPVLRSMVKPFDCWLSKTDDALGVIFSNHES